METTRVEQEKIDRLLNEINTMNGGPYAGSSWHTLEKYNSSDLAFFPSDLAERASKGDPSMQGLDNEKIRHEWTVKTGKRIFLRFLFEFGRKIKDQICDCYHTHKKESADLVKEINKILLLRAGMFTQSLWIPVAGFIAVLLVKKGLDKFCEGKMT